MVQPPFDPPSTATFSEVSEDEVQKLISNSPSNHLVKDCLDILLPFITKLVNYSLSEGFVPIGFKQAVVTPLIKKASLPPDDLKSYRPVSGCFISKLVERAVHRQFSEHVHLHNLTMCLSLLTKLIIQLRQPCYQ